MRRFGEAIVRGQAYRPRPGAYAVLMRAGRVLSSRQSEPLSPRRASPSRLDPYSSQL